MQHLYCQFIFEIDWLGIVLDGAGGTFELGGGGGVELLESKVTEVACVSELVVEVLIFEVGAGVVVELEGEGKFIIEKSKPTIGNYQTCNKTWKRWLDL